AQWARVRGCRRTSSILRSSSVAPCARVFRDPNRRRRREPTPAKRGVSSYVLVTSLAIIAKPASAAGAQTVAGGYFCASAFGSIKGDAIRTHHEPRAERGWVVRNCAKESFAGPPLNGP